jgi:hypothetical protein
VCRTWWLVLFGMAAAGRAVPSSAASDRAIVTVSVAVPAGDRKDLHGLELTVYYPKDKVSIPGQLAEDAVRARVKLSAKDLEGDDLFVASDVEADARLRLAHVRLPLREAAPIESGDFATVEFDRSGVAPADADFRCEVTSGSDANGQKFDGVRCMVKLSPP